ncbi:MAG: hypothetical protein LAT75_05270 [Candidatus Cyclonatronum sp.]|uniref:hypothetical protein n=1 Tax=Cyclonatronum sp. TaxID=3024185 RepID=UPI0025C30CA2|nr:hypothetical protein [Cyclonatronum sp.]MCC5934137.1 hypothetical protein [Balneolales bacterium]MCH8486254.1 hypothetical protein [Cyclonatronum sp.]
MLIFFSIASFFLSAFTLSNAWRLRNVRLSWNTGRFFGFPLFATLFMCLSLALGAIAWYNGMSDHYFVAGLYTFLAFNWMVASYFMSRRYITDHGIMKNINDPSQTVAWHEVHDFAENEVQDGMAFVFIYKRTSEYFELAQFNRLEVTVPAEKAGELRKILNHKLGRRFRYTLTDESILNKINIKP